MSSDTFLNMDYRIGLRLINNKLKEEFDEAMWQMWLSVYPNMNEDNFIPFTEFKEMHKPPKEIDQPFKNRVDKMVDKIRSKAVRR